MTFKKVTSVYAILMFLSGVGCMIMPAEMLSNYGLTLSDMGNVIYQFWGVSMTCIGIIAWMIRDTDNKQFAVVFAAINLLNMVMAIRGQFAGANDFGWSTVGLYALFSILYLLTIVFERKKSE